MPECRLLCVAGDEQLLVSRTCVLSLRYATTGARSVREMEELQGEFNLVLLCHSLSCEDRRAAGSLVRERWPKAKLLQIVRKSSRCPEGTPDVEADARVARLDGPRTMLRVVEELLHAGGACPDDDSQVRLRKARERWSAVRDRLAEIERRKTDLGVPCDRVKLSKDLIGISQRCVRAAQGSMASVRQSLVTSMEKVMRTREMITRCDERLGTYGALCAWPYSRGGGALVPAVPHADQVALASSSDDALKY